MFVKTSSFAEGIAIESGFGPSHPDIRFTTSTGQIITFAQSGAVEIPGGAHVRVLYDPLNPEETACTDSFGSIYFMPMLLGFIGGFMLLALLLPAWFVQR